MRRGGHGDDQHRRPHVARLRGERRRHDEQRHGEHGRLARAVHGPATLDECAREPATADRSDVRDQIHSDQRRRESG